MIATLPMYDLPETRASTDAFWAALALRLAVDISLTRQDDWSAAWRQPDLLFSQTCGYPFTHAYRGRLTYVATPHYRADGCVGPRYRSILFARESKPLTHFKGSVAAFNNRDSMSGMLALQLVFAPLAQNGTFFSSAVESGGHLASLAKVQAGEADVCAVDCVTVAYVRRYRPRLLEGLVEIGRSPDVPALPFVTVAGDASSLQSALASVFQVQSLEEVRDALLLNGFSVLRAEDYDEILALEAVMEHRGGLKLWKD